MKSSLRIAQVAPLAESIPPQKHGGAERVVSYLTEALVEAGHEVTLFASGDSTTAATLVPGCDRALRRAGCEGVADSAQMAMLERVYRRADEFDLIHTHLDYLAFPFARRHPTPTVTTLHGRLNIPMLERLYAEYGDLPVISISHAQRSPLGNAPRWLANIYHGMPRELLSFEGGEGDYLAFLGRMSPNKGVDAAIRVAIEADVPLKIAAKVAEVDREYFHTELEPMLGHPNVEFVGEIAESDKQQFLGNAAALLFMIDWPEPFGLAMIEAMACGTPVVARRRGSVPELVDEGITGYVCESEAEAIEAIERARELDRGRCRRHFERRFGADKMLADYVDTYRYLLRREAAARRSAGRGAGVGPVTHNWDVH